MSHRPRCSSKNESLLATCVSICAIVLLFLVGAQYNLAKEISTLAVETRAETNQAQWSAFISFQEKSATFDTRNPTLVVFQRLHQRRRTATTLNTSIIPPVARDVGDLSSVRTVASPAAELIREKQEVSWNVVSPFLPPVLAPLTAQLTLKYRDDEGFPFFERAVYPVAQVPNWGNMHSPAEWDRHFKEMRKEDFVPLPRYDLKALTIPMNSLLRPFTSKSVPLITAKLAYSTRYYGAYNVDAGEYTGAHPGIDLKLAFGTPLGAIGGGRVQTVAKDANMGLHVIIEHRVPGVGTFYSIYGHMDVVWVQEGQDVRPGYSIGTVGMTGSTTAPHVHLQVDRDDGIHPHERYWPPYVLTPEEADVHTMNPMTFIEKFAAGI